MSAAAIASLSPETRDFRGIQMNWLRDIRRRIACDSPFSVNGKCMMTDTTPEETEFVLIKALIGTIKEMTIQPGIPTKGKDIHFNTFYMSKTFSVAAFQVRMFDRGGASNMEELNERIGEQINKWHQLFIMFVSRKYSPQLFNKGKEQYKLIYSLVISDKSKQPSTIVFDGLRLFESIYSITNTSEPERTPISEVLAAFEEATPAPKPKKAKAKKTVSAEPLPVKPTVSGAGVAEPTPTATAADKNKFNAAIKKVIEDEDPCNPDDC
jgi:hypothetical protein